MSEIDPAVARMAAETGVDVEITTPEELRAVVDVVAQRTLGISGADFETRWRAGAYAGTDDPRVTRVASVLPIHG